MSYATQSQLARDQDFIARCTACASKEIDPASPTSAQSWVIANIWELAASPGFDDKYEYALNTGVGRPGWEASVITDGDILAGVQALLAKVPADPVPVSEESA
jgi:hypothetical protein